MDRQERGPRPVEPLRPALTDEEFMALRSPHKATQNPTKFDNSLWRWLVQTRLSAFEANEFFGGPNSFDAGPMWCFKRFGMTETVLPDRTSIYVGGEHEDFYDPDFFIYNDVIVMQPNGVVDIFGYPDSAFPPTDFHTATLVGHLIIIIGGLSYPERRDAGNTLIHCLDLRTMSVVPVNADGDKPGWIYNHSAELSENNSTIVIEGGEIWTGQRQESLKNNCIWQLSLVDWRWSRLEVA